MKIQKYAVAVAVLTAVSGSAMAATYTSDNGTITFHGMVNNNTCTISMKNEPLNHKRVTISTSIYLPSMLPTSPPQLRAWTVHWVRLHLH
jgi:type 1 fimbria pilin